MRDREGIDHSNVRNPVGVGTQEASPSRSFYVHKRQEMFTHDIPVELRFV